MTLWPSAASTERAVSPSSLVASMVARTGLQGPQVVVHNVAKDGVGFGDLGRRGGRSGGLPPQEAEARQQHRHGGHQQHEGRPLAPAARHGGLGALGAGVDSIETCFLVVERVFWGN